MPVLVAGAGVSGAAAARVLRELGARVTVVERNPQQAEPLREEGVRVVADDVPRRGRRWWSPRRAGGPTRRC